MDPLQIKADKSPHKLGRLVGPGLAQLVERLIRRYSESTSLNPSNLTSATVCGERTGSVLAVKRLACVAPDVDLMECTLHSPLQKANKAEPTLALKPRRDITSNPKEGYQWPQKRTCVCVRQKKKKKRTPKMETLLVALLVLLYTYIEWSTHVWV